MRVPEALEPLLDIGVIDEVVRPLLAGKEAQIYLVVSEGELRVAKVYKQTQARSFHNRADYTEGRRTRNTRTARALERGSRFGQKMAEEAWRNAEVEAIGKLRAAGVRVPEPHTYVDGVLVMEFVQDGHGNPAPRLADHRHAPGEARALFQHLLGEVVKMLHAGVVHGDLSDFNVLLGPDGPVIIDFPQAVDPAFNQNARKLLIRDVDNLQHFLGRAVPDLRRMRYGEELWDLYERGALTPETVLTGRYEPPRNKKSDPYGLLAEIEEMEREVRARREALGLGPPRAARKPVAAVPSLPIVPLSWLARVICWLVDRRSTTLPSARKRPVGQFHWQRWALSCSPGWRRAQAWGMNTVLVARFTRKRSPCPCIFLKAPWKG